MFNRGGFCNYLHGNPNGSLGCLYLTGGAKADNILSYNNAARYAAGLYLFGGGNTVTNCTFLNQVGFENNPSSGCSKIVNSIVLGGYDEWTPSQPVSGGNCFAYCASRNSALPGTGNIKDSLVFVDSANGDYHLKRTSAALGAGLYASWMDSALDLDGQRRTYGGTVDIGCYQRPRQGFIFLVR